MASDDNALKEESIRNQVAQLEDAKRKVYFQRLSKELKDPDTYAVLNWILLAGLHHFYVKNYLRGILNLIGFVVGITLFFSGYFIAGAVVIGSILIFELYELFFSQSIIEAYNNDISEKLLNDLR